jgi:hypothetical protein
MQRMSVTKTWLFTIENSWCKMDFTRTWHFPHGSSSSHHEKHILKYSKYVFFLENVHVRMYDVFTCPETKLEEKTYVCWLWLLIKHAVR